MGVPYEDAPSGPDPQETDGAFFHRPVLLGPCVDLLALRPDGVYVDGTAGGGGHSFEIMRRLFAMPGSTGRLVALDCDGEAVAAATRRLAPFGDRARVVRGDFSQLSEICDDLRLPFLDGFLLDLGVSSHQLDTPSRGFSYAADAPLDMRMDTRRGRTARDVVNTYARAELERILRAYGEERYAARIADRIVRERERRPIGTTGELAEIVKAAVPAEARRGPHHPAKRTFQAIRIEVNGELGKIRPALRAAAERLRPGGRVAVVSFHSLEDRAVKRTLAELSEGCVCPKDFPVCVCGRKPLMRVVTAKPILPDREETAGNPRARSAKLRAAERLGPEDRSR